MGSSLACLQGVVGLADSSRRWSHPPEHPHLTSEEASQVLHARGLSLLGLPVPLTSDLGLVPEEHSEPEPKHPRNLICSVRPLGGTGTTFHFAMEDPRVVGLWDDRGQGSVSTPHVSDSGPSTPVIRAAPLSQALLLSPFCRWSDRGTRVLRHLPLGSLRQ